MHPASARRFTGVIVPVIRLIVMLSFGAFLLIGAARDSAATTLVVVHAEGGPGHGAIAALATDDELVVSRSVGLMEGAASTDSATALGDVLVEISRSVGLMQGATATSGATALGDIPLEVSRSIGLMTGASN